MYVTHPGVVATSIAGLPWLLQLFGSFALYVARWLGSPWQGVNPYKGAVSGVFTALAPPEQLEQREVREGKGKWGSAVDVFGNERVVRTECEGWGYCGRVGIVPEGSMTKGQHKGFKTMTAEMREDFEETGCNMWREMEELRVEWEKILGPVDAKS